MDKDDDILADLPTKIYNRICAMIRHGELKPGQKLIQTELAEQLGVSRTPLLQAFNKLNGDHFVVNIPRHGSYVRDFSIDEIIGLLDTRIYLEPKTILDIETIDEEKRNILLVMLEKQNHLLIDAKQFYEEDLQFHLFLVSLCNNPIPVQLLRPFSILYQTEILIKTPTESLNEHREIVEALFANDMEKASELLYNHLLYTDRKVLENKLLGDRK